MLHTVTILNFDGKIYGKYISIHIFFANIFNIATYKS